MYKTLSINAVHRSSFHESDGHKNGTNPIPKIFNPDQFKLLTNEPPAALVLLNRLDKLFSKREKEVLLWMAEGLSSKMIADKLHISEHTVINHRRSMQEKSNKPNATALVSFAIRSGII